MQIRRHDDTRDQGFTLIELLVVVLIIGILAAIAIPVFLSQREKAADSATKSDLKNAATVMETAYVDTQAYPTTQAGLEALEGFKESEGVAVAIDTATSTADAYCLVGTNDGRSFYYDSDDGGLVDACA